MEIITTTKEKCEAKVILESLKDILREYGNVTVADVKDLNDEPSVYTDIHKGWFDLSKSRIEKTNDNMRYKVVLPDPIDLTSSTFYRKGE